MDFYGSGGSTGATTGLGWPEADDVAAGFRQAQGIANERPIVLYGASMGSAAILRAIATHDLNPDGIIIEAIFDRMLTTVQNRFRALGVPSFPSAQLLVFWGGRQLGFNGFRHNPCEYATRVRTPVLQLHGARDPRVSMAEAKRVYEALAGEKRWVEIEDAAHESYLAAQPDEWRREVGAFLNAIGGRL